MQELSIPGNIPVHIFVAISGNSVLPYVTSLDLQNSLHCRWARQEFLFPFYRQIALSLRELTGLPKFTQLLEVGLGPWNSTGKQDFNLLDTQSPMTF